MSSRWEAIRSGQFRGASVVYVLLASATFATASPLARLARPTEPFVIAAGRVLIGALVLSLIQPAALLAAARALPARTLMHIAGAGVLLAVHFGLFLWGLDETSLPAAVSLVSLEPLAVVVCMWAFHRLRPTRLEQIGVFLATAGAVVVASGAGVGEHKTFGDLLVLGAVVLFGFYVAAARGLRSSLPPTQYAALVYGSAALTLLPITIFGTATGLQSWSLSSSSWIYIGLLGLLPTVVGHTLVQAGARVLSPGVVSLVSPGETVGSIALGAFLLAERPSAAEWLGALVIIIGATVAIFGAPSAPRSASD